MNKKHLIVFPAVCVIGVVGSYLAVGGWSDLWAGSDEAMAANAIVEPQVSPNENAAAIPAATNVKAEASEAWMPQKAVQVATDSASPGDMCAGYGPQTPRDISSTLGMNIGTYNSAPVMSKMNLCNIHTHTHAEHKGPGFSLYAGSGVNGGYQCNGAASLGGRELLDPAGGEGAFKGVKPGDTIEVHWVHTTCDVAPGEGIGACVSNACQNPQLRVEAQVFLVVNDSDALDFTTFDYQGRAVDGYHQVKALPENTGRPIEFIGSTTGPSYSDKVCSPYVVTWSVRPNCARVDISSLHRWAENNPFNEDSSHGVRQLVTNPEHLSPIGANLRN